MFVPAFTTHVCLGAPYGWSAISHRLTLELGLVSPAAGDWSLSQTTWPMSIMIASGGISAAVLAAWTNKVGVRRAMIMGSLMFGTGMITTSLGIMTHSLPLLYLGNVISGVGYGCAYTPPLQALIDWFPDKKGLASGLVIAGFGSGALFFTPAVNSLASYFSVMPAAVTASSAAAGQLVQCTAGDLSRLPYPDLSPGLYMVSSGSSGLGLSLAVLGCVYSLLMLTSALSIARPPLNHQVPGFSALKTQVSSMNVPVDNVLSTPQFWLLFSTATLLASGGMALMSVASPLVQDVFSSSLPAIVTPAFASAYVMTLSVANLSGRVFWAAISDKIGTRNTFNILSLSSVPLYASIPWLISGCVQEKSVLYLSGFCVSSFLAVSIMGGVFSTMPPYEADLYGSKYVGANHGKFLPYSTIRGIAGPGLLLHLRNSEESRIVDEILKTVDPEVFLSQTGQSIEMASAMIESKTLTLSKLVSMLPPGTTDPSIFLYDSTMYSMAGLAVCASLLHYAIKPVDQKYFEKSS